jgi:quercetin dioxygenase-like cupin family protein
MTEFVPLRIEPGLLLETDGLRVLGFTGEAELNGSTIFGLVTQRAEVKLGPDALSLRGATYFVSPEPVQTFSGRGLAIAMQRYVGLRQIGGPIEARGRLRYIDGCSDTLLVSPPRRGDPCLNHLHIPPQTTQSMHTHESARIGVIAHGRGHCVTGAARFELVEGLGWYIPPGVRHAFVTTSEALDVLAWHPDSDYGPTDSNHPMVNRTVVCR